MSRSFGGTSLTTRSPMRTVREVMTSSPAIMRRVVLLPQPDGPTSTTNSRSATARSTESTAFTPPGNTLVTCSRSTRAIGQSSVRAARLKASAALLRSLAHDGFVDIAELDHVGQDDGAPAFHEGMPFRIAAKFCRQDDGRRPHQHHPGV